MNVQRLPLCHQLKLCLAGDLNYEHEEKSLPQCH